MSKLKEAGATHLAIEAPPSLQPTLDEYMQTGKLQQDKVPDNLNKEELFCIMGSCKKDWTKVSCC